MKPVSLPIPHCQDPALTAGIAPVIARLPALDYRERRRGEIESYGADVMLARQLALPRPLETYDTINWCHGLADPAEIYAEPKDLCSVLNYNYANAGKDRVVLVENARIEGLLRNAGYAHARAVGLPFIYEKQETEIPRIPGSVLAFGTHSTPWFSLFGNRVNATDGKSKELAFPRAVAALREQFPVVAACIGASDVLNGDWIPAYEHHGIPWVTGAWITDANALLRMQRILRSFEYVATNSLGSHIFYALYCGCKVFWHGDQTDVNLAHVAQLDPKAGAVSRQAAEQVQQTAHENFRRLYPFLFCRPEDAVTNRAVGAAVLGESHRLPPQEIAALLGWKLRARSRGRWEAADPLDLLPLDELRVRFDAATKSLEVAALENSIRALARRGALPRRAYYLLARLLEAHGKTAAARTAAEAELALNPDHIEAAAFLAGPPSAPAAAEPQGPRLLFVIHGPDQVNGPNIWLTRLLPALRTRGFRPRVLMFAHGATPCRIESQLVAAGVPCERLPFGYTEDMMRALADNVARQPCDLFVPNLNVQAYFTAQYFKAAGIPTVGVVHSDDDFHRDLIAEFITAGAGRHLDAAVVVSDFQAEALRELAPTKLRVLKAPYGAPVPASRATYANAPFRFIYVGRLVEEQKRISDTVQAMIALLRRRPEVEFHLCGDGSARGAVEALVAASGLGERIKIHGNLPAAEVQALSLKSQAFVLLSDYEGIPIALMEAMACGLVPICTQIRSGVGDLICPGENGFFVADRGDAFLAAAERLMDDVALWGKCSAAARETVEKSFSSSANADAWAELCRSLLAAAPTARGPVTLPELLVLPPVRSNPKGIAREDRRRPAIPLSTPVKSESHPFLNPALEPNNVDLYVVRSTILRAVKEALPHFHGTFLDIGCGVMPYKRLITSAPSRVTKYLGLDLAGSEIYQADVDLRWDGKTIPLGDASVDCAMATEVLEHCPDPLVVLREARRVLKPGGVFFFTVPFVWPLHDAPYDFFRYTPFALEKLLAEAGFTDVKLGAMSGWNASLAQMMGLWLKRSPLTPAARNQWAQKLWPLYQELVNSDRLPSDSKAGNTMTTGWTGIAHAPAAVQPATPEVVPCDLPVVIVRSHEHNYSETFLEDHVNFVSRKTTLLYGYPFPRFVAGRSVLPEALEQQLQAALAGGALTAELWRDYSAALTTFFSGCGARVALVETGLMGAFVHEACEQAALPFVVHFHGLDAFGRDLLERWRDHYQAFFKTAAQLIVVSQAMRDQLIKLGAPAERVVLAPYGVAVEVARAAEPATAGPTFIAVGRFVEKKAPHVTLTAFGAIRDQVPSARLIMIGDGPMLNACRDWAAKNGLADAVTFAGVQSREAVSRHMAASGIFVQHSVTAANGDSEGLPLAVLEAGAHGLPVVSTLHAGIPDAVRDGADGFLVAEKDVQSMAQAMLRLAQDPALAARLGASFRARVREQYSRKVSIERLQGLLLAAAEGRPVGEATPAMSAGDQAFIAITEDRNNRGAYLQLAEVNLQEGALADAYCALGELHRLTDNGADTREMLDSLESQGVLEHPVVAAYRERAGWAPRRMTERPQRVLVVTNLLPPQEMGGFGRTMWEFSRELTARGHTVLVLTADLPQLTRKPTPEHTEFETHVRRTLRLFGDWKGGAAVVEPDAAKRREIVRANHQLVLATAKEFAPDVVMVGNLDFVGHLFLQELLDQGVPVLHRLGNALPGFEPAAAPKSPRYCLAGCSEWVNDNLRAKGYPFTRYAVLPPGSPLAEYYRAFPPQRSVLKIAFASLLMPYKGAHVLMEALGHLKKSGIAFECTFAGDTTSPDYLEKIKAFAAQRGFLDRLRFPGFLAKKELAALYARTNVLVFPSVFEEPFGKTQIEAMAAGLLVISSGNGGARDIIRDGETGLFFRNNDSVDLAEKLAQMQRQPDLATQIAAAGQEDAFRFTTAASVDRLEAIIEELVTVAEPAALAGV